MRRVKLIITSENDSPLLILHLQTNNLSFIVVDIASQSSSAQPHSGGSSIRFPSTTSPIGHPTAGNIVLLQSSIMATAVGLIVVPQLMADVDVVAHTHARRAASSGASATSLVLHGLLRCLAHPQLHGREQPDQPFGALALLSSHLSSSSPLSVSPCTLCRHSPTRCVHGVSPSSSPPWPELPPQSSASSCCFDAASDASGARAAHSSVHLLHTREVVRGVVRVLVVVTPAAETWAARLVVATSTSHVVYRLDVVLELMRASGSSILAELGLEQEQPLAPPASPRGELPASPRGFFPPLGVRYASRCLVN